MIAGAVLSRVAGLTATSALAVRCGCCGQLVDAADLAAVLARMPMPRRQRQIVDILLERQGRWISPEGLTDRLYADEPDGGPDTGRHVVYSHLSKLAAKLRGTSLRLERSRHLGYRLTFAPAEAGR